MKLLLAMVAVALMDVFAASPARADDGCAPDTFSVTRSPDGRAFSVLFDAFDVTTGGGVSTSTSVCRLVLPVALPAGSIGVYKVDYRGFAMLLAQQDAELLITHAGGLDRLAVTGPYDDDLNFTNTLASDVSGSLAAEVRLNLRSADELAEALALLDSIDVAEIGFTSLQSVNASVARIAQQRVAVTTHLSTSADMLLGFNQRLDGPTEVGALAAVGSATVGANGRWRSDSGFTVSGGAAYVRQSAAEVDLRGAALLAAGLRYLQPDAARLRPFAELAVWGAPDFDTTAGRHYLNGAGATDTAGSLLAGSLRVGALYAPHAPGANAGSTELLVSLSVARSWLHVDGYAEVGGAGNLFPVSASAERTSTRVLKAAVAWSEALGDQLDFTLALAGGRTYGGGARVSTQVDWIGRVAEAPSQVSFLEYAARIGYRINPHTTLDAFVFGTKGSKIGSEAQVGAAIRIAL